MLVKCLLSILILAYFFDSQFQNEAVEDFFESLWPFMNNNYADVKEDFIAFLNLWDIIYEKENEGNFRELFLLSHPALMIVLEEHQMKKHQVRRNY